MAKAKFLKKALDSYTVNGTHQVVKAGDTVLMRGQDAHKPSYVAKIEKIEADSRSTIKVRVRWYYRPEESKSGRRRFHGAKELFLSDHYDIQSADTIEGKCTVHTFKNYTRLERVGSGDFFCRFEYRAATDGFTPDQVAVYCTCEMPYNPDDLMVHCESCKEWFHSYCVDLSTEQVISMDKYTCAKCAPDNHEEGSVPLHKTPSAKLGDAEAIAVTQEDTQRDVDQQVLVELAVEFVDYGNGSLICLLCNVQLLTTCRESHEKGKKHATSKIMAKPMRGEVRCNVCKLYYLERREVEHTTSKNHQKCAKTLEVYISHLYEKAFKALEN